jgi:hypothetical protein
MKTYSKAAAAKETGVTRQTMHRWVSEGVIHASPDGRIPESELARVSRVPLPEGFLRRRNTVTFTDSRGTQCQISIHRGQIMLTPINEDRVELNREQAARLSRILSAYAATGKFPPNDE